MLEPKITLGADLIQLVAEIDEFKGRWEALKNLSPERLRQLRKVATIESIGSSTRIEGAKLTDAEVEALLSDVTIASFETRDAQEVAGYAEAMDLVFQSFAELRLTENHIRQLHQTLLRHSVKDQRHRGDYKKLPNHVVARDAAGKEIGVVFETASPFDTPRAMEELTRWSNKAIDEAALHPLLIVAVFVVTFLAIHPFQDGNGRLSRILTTLMLLRAGYAYVPYASLESIVEDNKELYYKALRRTQSGLKKGNPDWEPWLGFFLRCLKKQKDKLAAKIDATKTADRAELPALALAILESIRAHERRMIAEIAADTGANRNTIKLRLRELVRDGRIRQHGKARATWYTLP